MADQKSPNPFDPAQFRAPNILDGNGGGITKLFTYIMVGKPKKASFFQAHPDPEYQLSVFVIEDESGGMKETYLVMPNVALAIPGEVKPKLLVLIVDRMGIPMLWPAPRIIDDGMNRPNAWNTTALAALEQSYIKWTRMSSNSSTHAYDVYTSNSVDEPQWPDLPMAKLIELAFGEDHVIRDADHPVIRRLLGRD